MPIIESVAKALLINKLGQVLVLTAGKYKEQPDKSFKPDLPGGAVDRDENEHEAVVREIMEETGITVDKSQLVMAYSSTQYIEKENKSVTKHLFVAKLVNIPSVTISREHSAYEWISLGELRAKEFRLFYDEAIKYCFSSGILSESCMHDYRADFSSPLKQW